MYRPDSLKTTTRRKRGKGTKKQVEGRKKLPANWPKFLRENDNKTELFHLLSERVTTETFLDKVVITHGDEMLCSEATNVEWPSPCTHEEANTRMLLHAADGVKQGRQNIVIRTVVVLAISFARRLGCESLVVAIGTGKSFRYIDATAIAHVLGVDKCKLLMVSPGVIPHRVSLEEATARLGHHGTLSVV